jgi:hypothetical protein
MPKVTAATSFLRLTLKRSKGTIFGRILRHQLQGEAAHLIEEHAIRRPPRPDRTARGRPARGVRLSLGTEAGRRKASSQSACPAALD